MSNNLGLYLFMGRILQGYIVEQKYKDISLGIHKVVCTYIYPCMQVCLSIHGPCKVEDHACPLCVVVLWPLYRGCNHGDKSLDKRSKDKLLDISSKDKSLTIRCKDKSLNISCKDKSLTISCKDKSLK